MGEEETELSTAECALNLLEFGRLQLPPNELPLFHKDYKDFYVSVREKYDSIETLLQFYSKILPEKAYPGDEIGNRCRYIARDDNFQKKIINSGIADKLRKGMTIGDLIRQSESTY